MPTIIGNNSALELGTMAGEFLGKPLAAPKRKAIFAEDFNIGVGSAEFCVQGEFESEDKSTGYRGRYTASRVWVSSDIDQTNISDFLSEKIKSYIEDYGLALMSLREREGAADYRETMGGY